MQIGDGPAAVTGDKRCTQVTDQGKLGREDAASRMNRESEDLPEHLHSASPWTRDATLRDVDKPGHPRIIFMIRGFFFAGALCAITQATLNTVQPHTLPCRYVAEGRRRPFRRLLPVPCCNAQASYLEDIGFFRVLAPLD